MALNTLMPEWVDILILGIVEGITEFLPVSSTGHLSLTQQLFGRWIEPQSDLFNIVIQSGAVLAVIPLFWHRISDCMIHWGERSTQIFDRCFCFVLTGGRTPLEKMVLPPRSPTHRPGALDGDPYWG